MIKYPILMKWIGTTTKEGTLVFRFTSNKEATMYIANGQYARKWEGKEPGCIVENAVSANDINSWEVYEEEVLIQYEPTDEWGCFMEGYDKCSQVKD